MQYRKFGNTGIELSRLGFGAMRLPMTNDGEGKSHLSMDESIDVLCYGFEQGINYVDTAYGYCGGESEIAVGRALKKGWRDKVYLSTKLPLWSVSGQADFRRLLEEQLGKLQVDHIDFYHFHGVNADKFENKILQFNLIDEAMKAKEQGLIRFLSFSFHDKPENMLPIIDTGVFDSVLCQYNLLDRANEPSIKYAAEKGLGVIAMGPVGGGRLAFAGSIFEDALGGKVSTPELAMRFVLSNPDINCALSGMSARQMVDDNVKVAGQNAVLNSQEMSQIQELQEKCKSLAQIYCTGCAYCMPCPFEVNIPACLEALIYHKVYRIEPHARNKYAAISSGAATGKTASACTNCGACEEKCPQKVKIREHLAEAAAIFEK
ncbi:MAG: aldo/keto reductase [Victivallaceae bacterium]